MPDRADRLADAFVDLMQAAARSDFQYSRETAAAYCDLREALRSALPAPSAPPEPCVTCGKPATSTESMGELLLPLCADCAAKVSAPSPAFEEGRERQVWNVAPAAPRTGFEFCVYRITDRSEGKAQGVFLDDEALARRIAAALNGEAEVAELREEVDKWKRCANHLARDNDELRACQPAPLAPLPEGEPFRAESAGAPGGVRLVAWDGTEPQDQIYTRAYGEALAATLNRLFAAWSAGARVAWEAARPAPPAPEGEPVAQTEPAFWARYSANPLGEAGEWECGPWPPPPHLVGRCLVLYRRSQAAPPPAAAPPDALRRVVAELVRRSRDCRENPLIGVVMVDADLLRDLASAFAALDAAPPGEGVKRARTITTPCPSCGFASGLVVADDGRLECCNTPCTDPEEADRVLRALAKAGQQGGEGES